jgi:hypothetical protein
MNRIAWSSIPDMRDYLARLEAVYRKSSDAEDRAFARSLPARRLRFVILRKAEIERVLLLVRDRVAALN